MKTNLFKSLLVATMAIGAMGGVNADEITATLVHTAGTRYSKAANSPNTVDSENEYYNNNTSSGYVGYAFAEFSFTIPEGETISKAELTWTANSPKNYSSEINYLNTGITLDYDKLLSTQDNYRFNGNKTSIYKSDAFKGTKTITTDVTDALNAISEAGQKYIIFQWTGNGGSATLSGKASDKAPVLKITTVSASSTTKYTIKYVDASGKDIKKAQEYDGIIGQNFTASTEDMAAVYTSDKKYIYESGNETKAAVKEAASNVITLKFREAEKYNYTVNNNINDNSTTGTAFEGDNATVAFSKYILKDGVLYEANAISQQYNLTFAVNEDNIVKTINYKKTSIDNVAYYSEAEDISTLTSTNAGYIPIRCSSAKGAYAATDAVITKLPAGTYKLTTAVFGNKGTTFNFYAGEKNIFTISTEGKLKEEPSSSFTLTEPTDIILKQAGNAGSSPKVLDYIIIKQEAVTVSVSNAGYATYATNYNVVVPEDENVKVMTVKVNAEGTAIELDEVAAGTVIPAKTGILVKADQGNHDFVVTSDKVTEFTKNDLKAATKDETSNGTTYFALTKIGDKVGFALVANGVVIPAGKAYLEVTKSTGTPAKFFGLDGEATGINSVKTAKADGAYYTLEGVKTTKPVKGLYIHNGKKIVVK